MVLKMNRKKIRIDAGHKMVVVALLLLVVLFCNQSFVFAGKDTQAPDILKSWEQWVMYGDEQYACPSLYDNYEAFRCVWPELLNLDFANNGGVFTQRVTALAPAWFYLPGDKTIWPLSVKMNGKDVPVLEHNSKPAIEIDAGKHTISGAYKWARIPQSFLVTRQTGIVALRINNKVIKEPFIDKKGRLWIQKKAGVKVDAEKDKNIVSKQIFRLIEDTVPIRIQTLIRLTVSGERRREKLEDCLPDGALAVSVITQLPVKLVSDGTIWVDVRPGQWDIKIINIINSSVFTFKPAITPYGDEIWSFKPYPDLRIARIEGADAVDPAQSMMPASWKQYTSYLIQKGDVVLLKEVQRGRPEAISDSLNLSREIWLDFDGRGATVKDKISGDIGQRTFLSMSDDKYALGKIAINGSDKLVTLLNGAAGVEVERGALNIEAVSRIKDFRAGEAIANGWNRKFQSAEGTLHIPPGYKIIGIKGGNAAYGSTWIDSWSMLDFFLILVVSIAIGKLFRWWWGLLFFIGLLLMVHEQGAPFYIWLVLLVTTAFYKMVSLSGDTDSRHWRVKFVKSFHFFMLILLCGLGLVFISSQLRSAMYPQLESLHVGVGCQKMVESDMAMVMEEAETMPQKRMMPKSSLMISDDEQMQENNTADMILQRQFKEKKYVQKPQQNVVTQTGPGIPAWQWHSVFADYGRTSEAQNVTYFWTGPAMNSLLSIFRALFLIIMIIRLMNINVFRFLKNNSHTAHTAIILIFACLLVMTVSVPGAYADIPDSSILTELEKRLKEPHDCFPACAFIPEAAITLPGIKGIGKQKQFVEIAFTVNAAVKTVIPLPSGNDTWQLYDLSVDDVPHLAVIAEKNDLWTIVPKGVHEIRLRGVAYGQKKFRFSFPLKPAYVGTKANGWVLSGINRDNQVDNIVQATLPARAVSGKVSEQDDLTLKNENNMISDFLRVKRTMTLGIDWNVVTIVERFVKSRESRDVIVELPLMKDELVKSDSRDFSVEKGVATINLAADKDQVVWYSSIPITSVVSLAMVDNASWAEVWELKQSAMWHSNFKGLPVIYPENTTGSFWYPWPGEKLDIEINRLESAPGESLTVDSVKAEYYSGKGSNRIVLKAIIRTTSGRTHTIKSPENTVIEKISINGKNFPLTGSPDTISLPLQPGIQTVKIEWNESETWNASWLKSLFVPRKISVPEIDLGQKLNNIDVYIHLPEKLWLIFTSGPRLGPAVLTWSLLGVVMLAALMMGRLSVSPLTTLQWLLLGIGLLSLNVPEIMLVAGWFIAMEVRKERSPLSPVMFNIMQVVLCLWTLFVMFALLKAISSGLAGIPDMQVAGNASSARELHWTLDQSGGVLPQPGVFVYSVYIYQLIMLIWALWLSFNIISWSKLCISAIKADGTWRPFIKNIRAGRLKQK